MRATQLFTFGCGQTFANKFIKIEAETDERCREIMFETFANKWSMQYNASYQKELESHHMDCLMTITELPDGRLSVEMPEQHFIRL